MRPNQALMVLALRFAMMDIEAKKNDQCPDCKGTKRMNYPGYGWCTCETCAKPKESDNED